MIGKLEKMRSEWQANAAEPVAYRLPVGEEELPLNGLLGKKLSLKHTGNIYCLNCERKSKKSFGQGYCFPCFKKLARCDTCIMKPETCHFDQGTCREPDWAEQFCFTDHYVYLANSSGLKVGITRGNQIPTRWIDQGAIQALPIFKVKTRFQSGLLEIALGKHMSDKTNWRKMLKGEVEEMDLRAERENVLSTCANDIAQLQEQFGKDAIEVLDEDVYSFNYPVEKFPLKVTSFNLDKNPVAEGVLEGIKGQYLLFDTGVINIRKFTSYEVEVNY